MHFAYVTIRTMKPGDDDDLVARGDPEERSREVGIHFEPRVRRSLRALPRRLVQSPKRRSNMSNRVKRVVLVHLDHCILESLFPPLPRE